MAEISIAREVKIAGQPFVLRSSDLVRVMQGVDPEPITSHYVVVGTRRFPPKQIISELTGVDRADLPPTTRGEPVRLGFPAGRRPLEQRASLRAFPPPARDGPPPLADRLWPFAGSWVAIRDVDVLHSTESPQELVAWLNRHGQKSDSMF